ncbi:MAG TPA: alpha/beta hydrolase [Burkholderiales bacterium]|nr:alpha/beta hydrolase [Burkholderiales bacterium]
MRAELVSIPTETIPLDGLFYEPESGPAAGAALLFHGNTMNFYVGALRFLPPVLVNLGLACLAFNRRGHDILCTRNSRIPEGGAFQLARESIEDNRTAAHWLAARGFPAPAVIGHSNGGMLAVQHVVDHPETPALVLLSAHLGGRNILERTSKAGLMAQDRVEEFTALARERVAAARGRELMLMPGWWYAISAESYLDRLTETPDGLALAPRVKCPVLYLRGDQESRANYPAEDFKARAGGPCTVEIVPDCDHFYKEREAAVQDLVSSWLTRTLHIEFTQPQNALLPRRGL